ncbi:MAG TPA: hypothetical protein ENK18_08410, partial [Deltaproteobacteria bacterium]|nr:hypothetical protein [Deltaproteobacteria bacterium]
MAMISIDFGNSYTKVGLRPALDEPSEPAQDGSLVFDDDLNLCIPTLAAVAERRGRQRWLFGTDVMKLGEGTRGVTVFRNWKPEFFDGDRGDTERDALAQVARDEAWARAKAALGLTEEQRSDFEALQPLPPPPPPLDEIARGYFRWLKSFLDPICAAEGIELEEAETRITLPAFGGQAKAEQEILAVLRGAGFRCARVAPCLPEPVANAIGIFTEGRNVIWRPPGHREPRPHLGHMFRDCRMFQAARAKALNRYGRRMHWTLIADLGGYTLDFAMVGFDLKAMDVPLTGRFQGKRRLSRASMPLGVADLDRRVSEALPPEQHAAFEQVIRTIDQRRLEALHRNLYQRRSPYVVQGGITLGGGGDMVRIGACLDAFAAQVADVAERFMEIEQHTRIDELILTGGGMNIPAVRDQLCERMVRYNLRGAYVPSAA